MSVPGNAPFRIGVHRVDPRTRRLTGPDGAHIALPAKSFDALLYLVTHRDRVVAKDELLERVWQGRVVEENNLTQAISVLRKAFGAGAGDHDYILTVPGRGYQWIAEVRPSDDVSVGPAVAAHADASPRRWPLAVLAGSALAGLVLLATFGERPERMATGPAATDEAPAMLAVLPFRTLATHPQDDLLVLGLAESLIVRLSASSNLRVSSLGSVLQFAGPQQDPLAAASTLGAGYVVEGSVQRHEGDVRVSARLLRAPSGEALWADTFDAAASEMFTVQDRMAQAVIDALALPNRPALSPQSSRSPCDGDDPDAFRAYLAGRDLMMAPAAERLKRAIIAFRRALDLDPTCARAWAGLAFAWRALAITGDADPNEAFPLVHAAVNRALELDPLLAEAHSSLAFAQFLHEWDWAAAEASARHAVRLNPSLAEARFMLANLLVSLGRFDEGLAEMQAARELDPLSPLLAALEAGFLTAADRTPQARAHLERALRVAPDFWVSLLVRGAMELEQGSHAAAIANLERAVQTSGGNSLTLAMLGMASAASGDRGRAEALLRQLLDRAVSEYVPATSLAAIELSLGNRDAALDLLERGLQQRDLRMSLLGVDARWNAIRDEPRFIAIAKQLGLESAQAHGRY